MNALVLLISGVIHANCMTVFMLVYLSDYSELAEESNTGMDTNESKGMTRLLFVVCFIKFYTVFAIMIIIAVNKCAILIIVAYHISAMATTVA